ncbi:(2Fe-2S)-binding protein [Streptomyces liangshanensis]|uniref:(2Fe-2S)-binding protein n=2 Tax=Streptomyces liangshanensis TaxID=2717324 RepID=A0A6G9H392_9ACTN|nr:(2Fe-2S)-binding protein [Streptomyces liangshanensis]QIQ04597.1 (2Fe-2S)-binding protein [Streptomyces liangshanensis]
MSTDEHSGTGSGSGPGDPRGGWEPVEHGGEYDAEATAFVQLPPEDFMDAPLAAPGHGYVPPQIVPLTPAADPSVPDHMRWPEPRQQGGQGQVYDTSYDPRATGHWNFTDAGQPGQPQQGPGQAPAQGQGGGTDGRGSALAGGSGPGPNAPSELTGEWTIPVAQGDLPDESGEFSASVLAAQWGGGTPPATLPGGAAAPWAPLPGTDAYADAPDAPASPDASPEPGPDAAGDGSPADAADTAAPEADPVPDADAEPALLTSSNNSAEHPGGSYVLRVNGADRPVTDAWIGESLLYVLRERLGLAGAKDGCAQGECGACNVQVDGRLVASCLVPAATAAGSEVRTVEGLAVDGEPSDVQRALAKCGAVQCGFCIPGMAMTVHDLLEGNHAPTELETRQALCGNLCRCSGYRGVLDAVNEVAAERAASAEAAAAASEEARVPHQASPGAGGAQPARPDSHANPHSPANSHSHDGGMA